MRKINLNPEKKRTLVTGGAGFIGSHLVRRLLEIGDEVHVIDKEKECNLEDVEKRFFSYKINIKDFQGLEHVIKKINPQRVFHLAAYLNRKRTLENIAEVTNTNIIGTINLVRALEKTDCHILVSAGTCEELGGNKAPFNESQIENPVSPYSWSKAAVSLFFRMLNNTGDNRIVVLRPTLVYGPYQKNNLLIPYIITSALLRKEPELVSGKQTRDFIYVSDMVNAYIKASEIEGAKGKIINISNGKEKTVESVVNKILEIMGNPIEPGFGVLPDPPAETYHYFSDNSVAKNILGWKPQIGLEKGLRRTIKWYTKMHKQGKLRKWVV